MPARVPYDNYEMFDSADSIEQAVTDKYGAPSGENFQAILDRCVSSGNIEDFHPYIRPASLNDINQTDHFRGFPYNKDEVYWYVDDVVMDIC